MRSFLSIVPGPGKQAAGGEDSGIDPADSSGLSGHPIRIEVREVESIPLSSAEVSVHPLGCNSTGAPVERETTSSS